MPIFNWIQTEFADGPNFVSDATDDVARALSIAIAQRAATPAECEFGCLRIESAEGRRTCIYLRFAEVGPSSPTFIHAVVMDPRMPEPNLSGIEAVFRAHYGNRTERRLAEISNRLIELPIAQGMLPVTELFVDESKLRSAPNGRAPNQKSARRRRRVGASLAWLTLAVVAGAAGVLAGRILPREPLASVSAPPPDLDLAERVKRLEADRGPAGMSLRAQLEFERDEFRRALEERDEAFRKLAMRVESEIIETEVASGEPQPAEPPKTAGASAPSRVAEPLPASIPDLPAPAVAEAPAESPRLAAAVPAVVPAVEMENPSPAHAVVHADLLWVREGPGTQYVRLSSLDGGVTVDLTGAAEFGWVQISSPRSGWVASDYLRFMVSDAEADPVEPAVDEEPPASDSPPMQEESFSG